MELLTTKVQIAAGESLFLKTIAAQGHTGSSLVSTFASNSGAMIAGYKSKVLGIDYEVTAGAVPDLESDQLIVVDGVSYVLQPAIDPATGKPNKPKAPAFKFETGARTMTLGLLQQGQAKSVITFKGFDPNDANASYVKDSTKLVQDDLTKIIGANWECTKTFTDPSNMIIRRNRAGAVTSEKPANCYEITITKA